MRLPWQHAEIITPPPSSNNNMTNIVIPLLLAAVSGAGAISMLYESRLTETRDIAKASAVKIENMQQQLSEMNTRLNIIVGRLTPQR